MRFIRASLDEMFSSLEGLPGLEKASLRHLSGSMPGLHSSIWTWMQLKGFKNA